MTNAQVDVCVETACFSRRMYDCAREILDYVLRHREEFLRNVRAGDGVLKVTTTVLKNLALELCGRDLSKGGGLGRLIRAFTAVAREKGFEVEYIISKRPSKTEKRTIYLKPSAKTNY